MNTTDRYELAREAVLAICDGYKSQTYEIEVCDLAKEIAEEVRALVPPTQAAASTEPTVEGVLACTCCGAAIPCQECGPFTDASKTEIDDPCRRCGKCINHCPHQ